MKNHTTGLIVALIVVSCGCSPRQQPGQTNLQGAAPTKLVVESGWKSSWAPDGKRLVYGKLGGAGLEIVDLESQQHTPVATPGKDADWSPTGQFIAYVREPSFNDYEGEQVWLFEVETGKTRHLIPGGFPTWSADGKTLYVTTRKERQILAIKVGSPDERRQSFLRTHDRGTPLCLPMGGKSRLAALAFWRSWIARVGRPSSVGPPPETVGSCQLGRPTET